MEATTEQRRGGTLMDLTPGDSAVILRVGSDKGPVKRRLVDMGLTPGTYVTVRKVAPFGDPIEVNIRGYELSLRKEDAAQIAVTASDAEAQACRMERSRRKGMVQHIPDEEMLRRMNADHEHEREYHAGPPDYASHDTREMKLALVGNPNCGKTTLFNALTGSNQYVGNWPGVTVEKKEGRAQVDGKDVTIVDLPGIYSLSPYSMEEIVARDFIVGEKPDAIIDIVDATNIERNLYLTAQLLELERPMVIALNFMDEVEKHGDQIDVARLSETLGVPVIPITARSGENVGEMLRIAHEQMHVGVTVEPDDLYDDYTHQIHHRVGELIHDRAYAVGLPAHWTAIKLIEGDELVEKALDLNEITKSRLESVCREYEDAYALGDRETLIADSRYQFIQNVVRVSVKKGRPHGALTRSDQIDSIVTNKYLAIPVFLLMMLAMFALTFGPLGSLLSDGVETLVGDWFAGWVDGALTAAGVAPWVNSLLVEGVIAGVGGVLTFLPQIALLFLFLSILEDSGYMARAAFIMDRLLRKGPPHDHHAGAFHVLLRAVTGIWTDGLGVLSQVQRACGFFPLCHRDMLRHSLRPHPEEDHVSGGAGSLCAGAASLPPADLSELHDARLGKGAGLPGQGGYSDPGHERSAVVSPELWLERRDHHGGGCRGLFPGGRRRPDRPCPSAAGLRYLAGGGGPAFRPGRQGGGGVFYEHVLWLLPGRQRRGHRRGAVGHLPDAGGRLRLSGLCTALCPLRGGSSHHSQGDELSPVDAAVHCLADRSGLSGVLFGIPDRKLAVPVRRMG